MRLLKEWIDSGAQVSRIVKPVTSDTHLVLILENLSRILQKNVTNALFPENF